MRKHHNTNLSKVERFIESLKKQVKKLKTLKKETK